MAKRPGLLSWQDYKIIRFRKLRNELYPVDFRAFCYLPAIDSHDNFISGPDGFFSLARGDMQPIQNQVGDNLRRPGEQSAAMPLLFRALEHHPDWDIVYQGRKDHPGSQSAFLAREWVAWALGQTPPGDHLTCASFWGQASLLFNMRMLEERDDPLPGDNYFANRLEAVCGAQFAVWADFYRDFYLSPWVCMLSSDETPGDETFYQALRDAIGQAGNPLVQAGSSLVERYPRLWAPAAFIFVTPQPEVAQPPSQGIPENALRVLINSSPKPLPAAVDPGWDLCIDASINQSGGKRIAVKPLRLARPWQGWLQAQNAAALVNLLDLRVHAHHLQKIEAHLASPPPAERDLSVIITTYHRPAALHQALESALNQTLPRQNYEILVVNNDPMDQETFQVVEAVRQERLVEDAWLRLVDSPLTGLSYARNAGLAEARGQVLCFLDDDAVAQPEWLAHIWRAFAEHPQVGVVGGHILLKAPDPRPRVLKAGLERFWTQFITPFKEYVEVEGWMDYPWGANWCIRRQVLLEMGGFRGRYGRRKNDYSGGEEIIAASLAETLGMRVAIEPKALVIHQPDPGRFTYQYLRKTIIAQIIINYHMKRDQYLPKSITILNNLRGTQRFMKNVFKFFRLPARERDALGLEYYYLIQAWVRLALIQLADLFWRYYYRGQK